MLFAALGPALALNAQPPPRCVAGELALPQARPWAVTRLDTVPKGRSGCIGLRHVSADQISGVVIVRGTPRGTSAVADAPHPRLMLEAMAQLEGMNIRIGEPKWRREDVPFSGAGMEGFGRGTMFGFDGTAIDGDDKSDVILFFFDGPRHHYDVSLVGQAESVSADEWRATVRAFQSLLAGMNRAAKAR